MKLLCLTLLTVLTSSACGGDDDGGDTSFEISSEPLMGTVNGEAWAFVAGETDAFLSEGKDDFFTSMYSETVTECAASFPSSDHLLVSMPKVPGDYRLSLQQNMTFSIRDVNDEIDNLVATRGRLVVSTITATAITGGLHARYDDDNEVDGQFTLTICAN